MRFGADRSQGSFLRVHAAGNGRFLDDLVQGGERRAYYL